MAQSARRLALGLALRLLASHSLCLLLKSPVRMRSYAWRELAASRVSESALASSGCQYVATRATRPRVATTVCLESALTLADLSYQSNPYQLLTNSLLTNFQNHGPL